MESKKINGPNVSVTITDPNEKTLGWKKTARLKVHPQNSKKPLEGKWNVF